VHRGSEARRERPWCCVQLVPAQCLFDGGPCARSSAVSQQSRQPRLVRATNAAESTKSTWLNQLTTHALGRSQRICRTASCQHLAACCKHPSLGWEGRPTSSRAAGGKTQDVLRRPVGFFAGVSQEVAQPRRRSLLVLVQKWASAKPRSVQIQKRRFFRTPWEYDASMSDKLEQRDY
jgi:hypothetical protein